MNNGKKALDGPVRLAFLGGPRSGKTSLISKLTEGSYRDTYYPLRKTTPVLFEFAPSTPLLRLLLDPLQTKQMLTSAMQQENVVLSPVIYNSLAKATSTTMAELASEISRRRLSAAREFPKLIELIDTPAFNPNQFVPFLEASLHAKLTKDVLRNLADEPRQPVNTEPLLVASGAGELNGAVDGYFLVYSAVPSMEPPSYSEVGDELTASSSVDSNESYNDDGSLRSVTLSSSSMQNTSLSLLPIIKSGLDEAWKEYHTYKSGWMRGEEKDIFNFKSALKGIFENPKDDPAAVPKGKLLNTSIDPADPLCPPPIWIVCTHTDLPLASPKLVADGRKLSKLWKCGFLALDVSNDVELALSLMLRELNERKNLQKRKRR